SLEEANGRIITGLPTSLARHDMGLATVIGKHDRDANGHSLAPIMRSRMQRLRMWNTRTRGSASANRNLMYAFNELGILKDKLALSNNVVEKAAYIYRKAQARGLVKGRTISALLAACVYAACREMQIPRTLRDITTASNIRRKDIARNYRIILYTFDFKVPIADPMKCIAKVANKANLNENTKRQAINMMKEVTDGEIPAGKDPMGIAATVLYISCLKTGEDRTQNQMAHAAGVTEVTLRNRYKELKIKLHLN
ncbi:MAG TPA: transcription initiation factor IIB, partial [Nitrososphaeraceae archaeon]|nr:transcription initiation factor IIB [Nitrososphaeraceae archaeon]